MTLHRVETLLQPGHPAIAAGAQDSDKRNALYRLSHQQINQLR